MRSKMWPQLYEKLMIAKIETEKYKAELPIQEESYHVLTVFRRVRWSPKITLMKSSLLYGVGTWRLTDRYAKKTKAVEMDAIRRFFREYLEEQRYETNQSKITRNNTGRHWKKLLVWYEHVNQMNYERLSKQPGNQRKNVKEDSLRKVGR